MRGIRGRRSGKRTSGSRATKTIFITAAIIFLVLAGAGVLYASRIADVDQMFKDIIFNPDEIEDPEITDVREAFPEKTINILLMGFDRNEARDEKYTFFRADTLMLASINLESGNVDIVSIPRDTLVPIYKRGGGMDKINSAFGYGWRYGGASANDSEARHRIGMKYQIETVSMALKGIPVHYYITIDMEGVVDVVNILGGVWYDVEKRVYHKDGRILLDPGYQKLNGRKFLDFVRGRRYSTGDIQRVKNQQSVLIAAFEQFKQADKLVKAPQVLASVNKNLETDLTLEQIMSLTYFASQNIDKSKITSHVLETYFAWGRLEESWTKSYSYLIVNQKKRVELIYEIWGVKVKADPTDKLLPPLPHESEPPVESDQGPSPGMEPADPENSGTDPEGSGGVPGPTS